MSTHRSSTRAHWEFDGPSTRGLSSMELLRGVSLDRGTSPNPHVKATGTREAALNTGAREATPSERVLPEHNAEPVPPEHNAELVSPELKAVTGARDAAPSMPMPPKHKATNGAHDATSSEPVPPKHKAAMGKASIKCQALQSGATRDLVQYSVPVSKQYDQCGHVVICSNEQCRFVLGANIQRLVSLNAMYSGSPLTNTELIWTPDDEDPSVSLNVTNTTDASMAFEAGDGLFTLRRADARCVQCSNVQNHIWTSLSDEQQDVIAAYQVALGGAVNPLYSGIVR